MSLPDLLDEAYEALYDDRLPDARRLFEQAKKQGGDQPDTRLLEIDLLEAEGQGEEAVGAAEEAVARHKKSMILAFRHATLLLDVYEDVGGARPILEELGRRLSKGDRPDVGAGNDAETKEAADDFALEIWLTLSDVRASDLDPHGALAAAEEAVKLAGDDAMARVAKAAALFDLCRVDDAEKIVAQAIDRDPRCADAWWLRGRIETLRGHDDKADKAFTKAVSIDGERFAMPYRVDEDTFAKILEEAIEELPEKVREGMKNVDVIVEGLPDVAMLQRNDPPLSPSAVGLFDPEPLAPGAGAGQPVRIFVFRKNLEISCFSEEEMIDEIGVTLLHEIGHHLGLDEDDLTERGLD